MTKVLISDKLAPEAVDIFKEAGIEVDFKPGLSADELAKIIGDYDDTSGKKNFIQIMCVGATEFWYTISQPA